MKKTDPPIVVEETYATSKEKAWAAITESEHMQQWFFAQIKSFKAEEGFETQFLVENEGRKFTHLWKVTEVIPNQKITYNWKYKEHTGDSFVTFELKEEGKKVKIKLTTEVTENFPSDIPEFKRESCVGGWNYFIKENLKKYLES